MASEDDDRSADQARNEFGLALMLVGSAGLLGFGIIGLLFAAYFGEQLALGMTVFIGTLAVFSFSLWQYRHRDRDIR